MKFKCCNSLMYHLVFAQSDVMACCCSSNHKFIKFFKQEDNKEFDIERYKERRTFYINLFKQNIIPEGCFGCPFIKEQEWNEEEGIKNIIISNHTKCSCNCIYCSLLEGENTKEKKQQLNTRKTYDIKPILILLKENNKIQSGCNIQIAGGEPSEYPNNELEWLLNYGRDLNCNIEVLSSAIIYSTALESALKTSNIKLLISPDSAIKRTYELIKRVNAYDKVWENIKKYINASRVNEKANVYLKYIILPGINDNMTEVSAFIEKCIKLDCHNIVASIDFNWFEYNKNTPVTNNLKEVINYFVKLSSSGITCCKISFESQVEYWFKKNSDEKFK